MRRYIHRDWAIPHLTSLWDSSWYKLQSEEQTSPLIDRPLFLKLTKAASFLQFHLPSPLPGSPLQTDPQGQSLAPVPPHATACRAVSALLRFQVCTQGQLPGFCPQGWGLCAIPAVPNCLPIYAVSPLNLVSKIKPTLISKDLIIHLSAPLWAARHHSGI